MRISILLIVLSLSFTTWSQEVKVYNFDQLEKQFSTNSDSVIVINFWATWCRPCVEELPDFVKLNNELQNEKFRMVLVSLDFTSQIEKRLKPFIIKNNISAQVIVLDEPDPNSWIDKVNPEWDGNIPITLIVTKNGRDFHGKSLEYAELKTLVKYKLK